MALSTRSLARSSSRHPWRTVGLWVVGIMVAGALIGSLKEDALTQEVGLTNNPEAKQAADLIEERLRGPERDTEIVIVSSQGATVDDPAFEAYVTRLSDALRGLGPDVVLATQTYYESQDQNLVSRDRHITLVPTVLAGPIQDAVDHVPELKEAIAQNRAEGFTVNLSGAAALGDDFNTVSAEDLRTGESIGVMAALIILVVVFGAVVAATLPILVGIAAIAVGLGIVVAVGQITQFSFFVENMITMMGLAVGIDYSLFVVSRYREERRRGRDKLDAIEAAGATASRAVLFSGMTVVLALLGMLMIPNTIFRSLASGAIFAVVAAVLASMTLLPALLGLLGDRINRLRIHRRDREPAPVGGFWDKVTHGVMARPVLSLVAGVGVLLFLGSFWAVMHTGFSGVSTVPDGLPSKEGFEILGREFSGGLSSPVEIAIDGRADDPAVQAGVQRLRDSLAADGMFGSTRVEVNEARDLTLVSAPLNGDPDSRAATDSIGRIRSEYVPDAFPEGTAGDVLVGGRTAFNKDFFDISHTYMPIVFVFVLGLSFILLTVAFRSLVVPLKAILLNLLSVAAAYGLITLVFQEGVGADLLGFQQVEVIEAWLPLFLFSVLFGLSMDYHVFLLSRIREHYDQTGDNTGSVAYGLRTTAGIITGAALIMVAVFGGFASGRMAAFQQMGFGLAAAVLIDATLIRSVLVPASMKLLGNRNWYLPRWLEWLPKVTVDGDVEATKDERAAEPVGAGQR
ncbi:MAG TPA: efflux RND transporter permease subunit [Acidimicrobiales bacterium]|nr:efflux RND transporter permease subunit [Acidimicrobiales bacterium]